MTYNIYIYVRKTTCRAATFWHVDPFFHPVGQLRAALCGAQINPFCRYMYGTTDWTNRMGWARCWIGLRQSWDFGADSAEPCRKKRGLQIEQLFQDVDPIMFLHCLQGFDFSISFFYQIRRDAIPIPVPRLKSRLRVTPQKRRPSGYNLWCQQATKLAHHVPLFQYLPWTLLGSGDILELKKYSFKFLFQRIFNIIFLR